MIDRSAFAASTGWRRYLSLAFIYLWLAIQIGGPFTQKFELPSLRYRYTRFAWAMYSQPSAHIEVTMYRTDDQGEVREAIPDIARYAVWYSSPETMHLEDTSASARAPDLSFDTELDAKERFSALIRFIAEKQRDGYAYVVSGRTYAVSGLRTKNNNPRIPNQWEVRAKAFE